MVVEVKNVSKKFKNVSVLSDVNLEFKSGKIYGLIGRNGSGKSVFLKILCGFYEPTSGAIIYDNVDINKEEQKVKKEESKEIKEEPKKEIMEQKPSISLRGKKSKKEPRIKPDKEKGKEIEEIKPKDNIEINKKESVQELEQEVEKETKEINTEVEKELKKTSVNNTLELTTTHQENFGIKSTPPKQKVIKEKSQPTTNTSKAEFQSSKNYHPPETPNFNPYSMFPMFNPMMMPNNDAKGGQQPLYYMVPFPVDDMSSHLSQSMEYL